MGFDPTDNAQYAAEAAPILGGLPIGPDKRTSLFAVLASFCWASHPSVYTGILHLRLFKH